MRTSGRSIRLAASSFAFVLLGATRVVFALDYDYKHEDLINDDEFRARCVTVQGDARLRVVEPACAYLASFLSHDGSRIPLAADAWRQEFGRNTGNGADQIRASVESPAFEVIKEVRDIRWFVDGDNAVAYYVLDLENVPGLPPIAGESVLLAERFKVERGLIEEIEALFIFCPVTAVNTAEPTADSMCPAPF